MSSSSSSRHAEDPIWIVQNPGSFSSITVQLPPRSSIHCESDGVITFSHGVQVRGVMASGLFGALARTFLTNESFYTTVVENTNSERVAEVMLAPSDPGCIVLHKLTTDGGGDLLLTSGAYVASDVTVAVTSEVQGISNSVLSDTGFFLLRAAAKGTQPRGGGGGAAGGGYVAFGAYGAVHKYVLGVGEIRSVDNGHLVAWTASTNYRVGLASSDTRSSTSRRILNSMTSGEGFMCHFEGPGTVYLQSHKPDPSATNTGRRSGGGGGGGGGRNAARSSLCSGICVMCVFVMFILLFVGVVFYLVVSNVMGGGGESFDDEYSKPGSWQQQQNTINEQYGYNRGRREF
mmetsp:Transcript_26002/g.30645  ORF Transcript_26002/g.30645 Transcript_26002/m.30645 type:complete len:346 (+) Transcript_26002:72-1109(+)|eukprot:CAMPEP_0198257050 /NCGR_PEP_ID=MMETSP1447-20131203/6816_1 /TAXON_ID=420782 /ORGANISM="Chaetoceros dichaeta, Strain CCMP1751" /LENGTH=345 /DNA_ID=CAMNT_0043943851 /DNA_START=17 /DNA_END=1054 /DNA_ORIENTATION=+